MISDVLYFEKQETWLWQETCRAWQFHSVYLTTASGVQQRASTLKQEKGVLRFMSLMKHFRNFALSEVKDSFLKLSLSTYFRFCRLCLRWKGLVLLLSHFIDLTLSFNGMQLFKKICYSTDSFYHIIQIFVHGTCKNVRQFSEIKSYTRHIHPNGKLLRISSLESLLGFSWKWQESWVFDNDGLNLGLKLVEVIMCINLHLLHTLNSNYWKLEVEGVGWRCKVFNRHVDKVLFC